MASQSQGQLDDAQHIVAAPTIEGLMSLVTAPRAAVDAQGRAPLSMKPMPRVGGSPRRRAALPAEPGWLQALFVGLRRGLRQQG